MKHFIGYTEQEDKIVNDFVRLALKKQYMDAPSFEFPHLKQDLIERIYAILGED